MNIDEYNVQIYIIIISSLFTLLMATFLNKKKNRYSMSVLILYIFKCYLFSTGLILFFAASALILKINAGEGIQSQIPEWLSPWWYLVALYSYVNIITTTCYFYTIGASSEYFSSQAETDMLQGMDIKRKRYEIRYSIVSLIFGIFTIFSITGILMTAMLLCDPGNC